MTSAIMSATPPDQRTRAAAAPPAPGTRLRVALLEDMPEFAAQLRRLLEEAGHDPHWRDNEADFLRLVSRDSFDLAILDWQLAPGGGSGEQALRWMRHNLPECPPVIFLTSRGDERGIAEVLDLGADDYLVKPVGGLQLLARIRAVTRRHQPHPLGAAPLRVGDLELDAVRREIRRAGQAVDLSPKEYAIAALLLRNLGRLLTREQIYESAWGRPMATTTRTVDTHVSAVRVRLALHASAGWRLTSVYQRGYRLELLDEPEGADAGG